MPKKIDHEARRAAIAGAVWQLMARGGLGEVSMRHVATCAGMSLGQVQHYFPSKNQLLAHAYDLVAEQLIDRVRNPQTPPTPPTDEQPTPRETIHDALVELLPLDEDRELEAHISFAFRAKAAVTPDLAARLRKTHDELLTIIVDQLRRGQRHGIVPIHLHAAHEARTLLAVVDGLVGHVLIGHQTPEEADVALNNYLDGLFTG